MFIRNNARICISIHQSGFKYGVHWEVLGPSKRPLHLRSEYVSTTITTCTHISYVLNGTHPWNTRCRRTRSPCPCSSLRKPVHGDEGLKESNTSEHTTVRDYLVNYCTCKSSLFFAFPWFSFYLGECLLINAKADHATHDNTL